MKLPDSPHDRRARNDALTQLAKRLAIAGVPTLIVAALAHSLGVPWFLVLVAVVFIVYLVVFEA